MLHMKVTKIKLRNYFVRYWANVKYCYFNLDNLKQINQLKKYRNKKIFTLRLGNLF